VADMAITLKQRTESPELAEAIEKLGPMSARESALVRLAATIATSAATMALKEVRSKFHGQIQTLQQKILEHDKRHDAHKRHLGNLETKLSKLRGDQ